MSELKKLGAELHLLDEDAADSGKGKETDAEDAMEDEPAGVGQTKEYLLEVLVSAFEKKLSQFDAINDMPLYPNEVSRTFDENKHQLDTSLFFLKGNTLG